MFIRLKAAYVVNNDEAIHEHFIDSDETETKECPVCGVVLPVKLVRCKVCGKWSRPTFKKHLCDESWHEYNEDFEFQTVS